MTKNKNFWVSPAIREGFGCHQNFKSPELDSEEFFSALADLNICATVLEPYSERIVDAIAQFVEDLPDDESLN